MIERISGLATRIQNVCEPGLIQMCCNLHQVDPVMQLVYSGALKKIFYSKLITLIGHLRRQRTLISKMRFICLKLLICAGFPGQKSLCG